MINVYSKSDHSLGRLLSNFAKTPFLYKGYKFMSVEGWWYWYKTGERYDDLRFLWGFKAKEEGRKLRAVNTVTPEKLKEVYLAKLHWNPKIKEELLKYTGEFDHYYVYGNKIVRPDKYLWTAKLWEEIRNDFLK